MSTTLENLLSRYTQNFVRQDATNVVNLMTPIAAEIDCFMTALGTFEFFNVIDTQVGPNLDQIGLILVQPRQPGWNDATYRQFLKIAILENNSNGSLEDILAILYLVTGALGGAFQMVENYNLNWPMFLDGSRVLDGSWPLAGNFDGVPASFEARCFQDMTGTGISSEISLALGAAVARSRATGINGYAHALYTVGTGNMRLYNGGPTGTGVGSKYFMALGTGATGPAMAGDTGLATEVLRRKVSCNVYPGGAFGGYATWVIPFSGPQFNGPAVNEIALFNGSGVMIAKYAGFSPLTKDLTLLESFCVVGH